MKPNLNYTALHKHYTLLIWYATKKIISEMSYFRIQSETMKIVPAFICLFLLLTINHTTQAQKITKPRFRVIALAEISGKDLAQ